MDRIEKFHGATIQHGPASARVYLMKPGNADPADLAVAMKELAGENKYTKIFAKVPETMKDDFIEEGYIDEAFIPGFYRDGQGVCFMAFYLSAERAVPGEREKLESIQKLALEKGRDAPATPEKLPGLKTCTCGESDLETMAEIYKTVFPSYPFPITDTGYLLRTMKSNVRYFKAEIDGRTAALSSAEMYPDAGNAEMTDFATLPEFRGKGLALHLLYAMDNAVPELGIHTGYTIARAVSPGMNITFAKAGYKYAGQLVNNTDISGSIESMNVWYKKLAPNSTTFPASRDS